MPEQGGEIVYTYKDCAVFAAVFVGLFNKRFIQSTKKANNLSKTGAKTVLVSATKTTKGRTVMKFARVLSSAPVLLLCANAALAEQPKQVEVVNSPLSVTVENQLDEVTVSGTVSVSGAVDVSGSSVNATIVNTPDVNVANVPDVFVSNTPANPLPVSVVSNPNPNLPATPMFAFKNAEGGGHPVLFGPLPASAKIAIGSITFDGGDDTYGTQVWLNITDCDGVTLDLGPAYMVRNRAAGLGPQHMVFPIPMVIPFEDPGEEWCFEASPATDDQTLITVVGYLVE